MPPKKKSAIASGILEELLASGAVVMGDDPSLEIVRISWGIPELDRISAGGLPRGRFTIISGEYSAGKSWLLQSAFKSALSQGLTVAYIDTERSFDKAWWAAVGIDTAKVIVSQPPSGEAASDVALSLAEAGIDIIGVDSLAGMIPTKVMEEDTAQQFIGLHARLLNRFMEKSTALKHQSVMLCTNQLRSTIAPGPSDTMPGGRGQNFYSHLILRVRREGWIEERGEKVGFNIKAVCSKSKIGTPWGECALPFRFRGDIDRSYMMIERGIEAGLIVVKGPWYYLFEETDGVRAHGKAKLSELLQADDVLQERLTVALGD